MAAAEATDACKIRNSWLVSNCPMKQSFCKNIKPLCENIEENSVYKYGLSPKQHFLPASKQKFKASTENI